MIHLSPQDYRMEKVEIPDGLCYWEPQGNGHYYTTCGELVFRRNYKEKGITHCHICNAPIYDGENLATGKMSDIKLYNGDCLEVMDELIAKGVVVDAIICDPPYQTTACEWDIKIPFNNYIMLPKSSRSKKLLPVYRDDFILQELKKGKEYKEICDYFDKNSKEGMWQKLNKLIKPNGAIVLFGSEPFSSALRMSNIKNYKYDWVWDKKKGSNYATAKKMPLKNHEIISVFQNRISYIPQMRKGKMRNKKSYSKGGGVYGGLKSNNQDIVNDEYYPTSILEFSNANQKGKLHPTQKPVALMEYLIKTYTNENELVLDNCAGSGTTAVACVNTNRNFIGIELDKGYCEIAQKRIEQAQGQFNG